MPGNWIIVECPVCHGKSGGPGSRDECQRCKGYKEIYRSKDNPNVEIRGDLLCINGHEWRPGADLTGMDFSGIRISGYDLPFPPSYQKFVKLSNVNLEGANLSGASLEACGLGKLRGANLRNATLHKVFLGGADLDLDQVDLRHATLTKVAFDHAHMRGADLRDAVINECSFNYTHLENANMFGAKLTGGYAKEIFLRGATLPNGEKAGIWYTGKLREYGLQPIYKIPFDDNDF